MKGGKFWMLENLVNQVIGKGERGTRQEVPRNI